MNKIKWLFQNPQWATRRFVWGLILVIFCLSIFGGNIVKPLMIQKRVDAAELKMFSANRTMVASISLENQKRATRLKELDLKLKTATATPKAQQLTPDEAREMIALTFPKEVRARFEKITMQCENGRLKSDATNVNKDGSKDIGMAQINDKWHRARVEKMFGMEFEVAMKMPILNYIYSAFLQEHSGNFEMWACNTKV